MLVPGGRSIIQLLKQRAGTMCHGWGPIDYGKNICSLSAPGLSAELSCVGFFLAHNCRRRALWIRGLTPAGTDDYASCRGALPGRSEYDEWRLMAAYRSVIASQWPYTGASSPSARCRCCSRSKNHWRYRAVLYRMKLKARLACRSPVISAAKENTAVTTLVVGRMIWQKAAGLTLLVVVLGSNVYGCLHLR